MHPESPQAAGETIGERLKRLRLEKGFSQRELAAPGVSYAYISRIEAGSRQPSVKALRRLAAAIAEGVARQPSASGQITGAAYLPLFLLEGVAILAEVFGLLIVLLK